METAVTNGASAPARKLKILMLHGYTQSGHLFNLKTKALQKSLAKQFPPAPQPGHLKQYPAGVEFHYPTGPIRLDVKDIPGYNNNAPGGVEASNDNDDGPEAYGWWKRKGDGSSAPYRYEGMDQGLEAMAQVMRDSGPFDGVIGFSQGGCAAAMLASLLDRGRREAFVKAQQDTKGGMAYPSAFADADGHSQTHAPLRFAVSYSGFGASENPRFQAFYEPRIATPMCHFIGSVDTVVEESRSLFLVDKCENGRGVRGGVPRVVYHPGGHFLPIQKQHVNALVVFIREAIGEAESNGVKKEESVEDMEMPF